MATTSEIIVAFADLEIPMDQAKAYLSLLGAGSWSEDEAQPEIGWLETEGLAFSELSDDNRLHFFPLDPTLVLTAFYYRQLWHYTSREGDISTLPASTQSRLLSLGRSVALLSTALADRSNRRQRPGGFVFLEGRSKISTFLVQLINDASEVFSVTAAEWTTNLPLIWAALVRRLANGMVYRRVCSELVLVAFGQAINRRDVFEVGVDLRVLPRSAIREVFHLATAAGTTTALLFHAEPLATDRKARATFIDNASLVRRFTERAQNYWSHAVPAGPLLERIDNLSAEYLERVKDSLGTMAAAVAREVFDYGVFSKPDTLGISDTAEVVRQLVAARFLLPLSLPIGAFGYVANIVDEVREILKMSYSDGVDK